MPTYEKKIIDGKEILYERDAFGDWKIGEYKETDSSDGSKRLDSGWFGVHSSVVNRADITGKRKAVIDGKDGSFKRDAYDQRYHFKDSSEHTKTNGYSIGSYSSGNNGVNDSDESWIIFSALGFCAMGITLGITLGWLLHRHGNIGQSKQTGQIMDKASINQLYKEKDKIYKIRTDGGFILTNSPESSETKKQIVKYVDENGVLHYTEKQIVKQESIDDIVRMSHSRNSIYYRRGKNGESILTNVPDQSIEDVVREKTVDVRVYSYVDENGVLHYTNEVPKDENNQNEIGSNDINLRIVESEPTFKFKIPVPKLTTYYDDNGKLNCEYTGKLPRRYRKICDVVKKIPKD